MKRRILAAAAAIAMLAPSPASAANHQNKFSQQVHAATSGCVFFSLEGVTEADSSVTGGSAFFALPTNHPNFQPLYAILLSANLGRRAINVITEGSGVTACGVAAVSQISLV